MTRKLYNLAIFLTFSGIAFSQNLKEMYPKLGRSLDFDPKVAEQWEIADKIIDNIHWDFSKLTEDNKRFFKKINYDLEKKSEVSPGYYDVMGGGCCWYCGWGVDSISASSYLKSKYATINYLPENAHDMSFQNAWVPGGETNGIGEYLTYYFLQNSPRITKIIVANGYVKSKKAWVENSRVKKLKMYIDNKPYAILNLEDNRREQIFEFSPIGKGKHENTRWEDMKKLPKWSLKFEILEVYEGDWYNDVAISEIYFDGIDVH